MGRIDFDERFAGPTLDRGRWIPHLLPQWSSRRAAAARYEVGGGRLRLMITADQELWCPELDGDVRVSPLQTGVLSGPLRSTAGQHRFHPAAVVREEQAATRLYTPHGGRVEMRARALDDPRSMVALWMIGFEDAPERSAETSVCETFGREVGPDGALVGRGMHPFGDPAIEDDFAKVPVAIDVREPHLYAVDWGREGISFSIDGQVMRTVAQSPDHPMQLMLGIYEFPPEGGVADERRPADYPKLFEVEHVRGNRPVDDDWITRRTSPPPGAGPPLPRPR